MHLAGTGVSLFTPAQLSAPLDRSVSLIKDQIASSCSLGALSISPFILIWERNNTISLKWTHLLSPCKQNLSRTFHLLEAFCEQRRLTRLTSNKFTEAQKSKFAVSFTVALVSLSENIFLRLIPN